MIQIIDMNDVSVYDRPTVLDVRRGCYRFYALGLGRRSSFSSFAEAYTFVELKREPNKRGSISIDADVDVKGCVLRSVGEAINKGNEGYKWARSNASHEQVLLGDFTYPSPILSGAWDQVLSLGHLIVLCLLSSFSPAAR